MPMYDRVCENNHQKIDCWEPITFTDPTCLECGKEMKRAWLSSPPGVIADDIPGGVEIRNGICNEDGSPKRYYSKSDMVKAAKAKGLVNMVEHITSPLSGSDKSPHTTKWF